MSRGPECPYLDPEVFLLLRLTDLSTCDLCIQLLMPYFSRMFPKGEEWPAVLPRSYEGDAQEFRSL